MFPHHNPLPVPQALKAPRYDEVWQGLRSFVLDYIADKSPDDLGAIRQTLDNNSELLTKVMQALAAFLVGFARESNYNALQMFGMYSQQSDLIDVIVSQLNVKRQVLEPGDPNAFPPVPPTLESDDDLLARYYLAPFALSSAGPRAGYRYHAMTLDGMPQIAIDSPTPGVVVTTYTFAPNEFSGLTKDAQARQVAPGEVDCVILAHAGNGTPGQDLLQATQQHLERDEIGQETDLVTVKPAAIISWSCQATLYIAPGPDRDLARQAAEQAIANYGQAQHRLMGRVEPSKIDQVLLDASGAIWADIQQPSNPIRCDYTQAPHLGSIQITVISEAA